MGLLFLKLYSISLTCFVSFTNIFWLIPSSSLFLPRQIRLIKPGCIGRMFFQVLIPIEVDQSCYDHYSNPKQSQPTKPVGSGQFFNDRRIKRLFPCKIISQLGEIPVKFFCHRGWHDLNTLYTAFDHRTQVLATYPLGKTLQVFSYKRRMDRFRKTGLYDKPHLFCDICRGQVGNFFKKVFHQSWHCIGIKRKDENNYLSVLKKIQIFFFQLMGGQICQTGIVFTMFPVTLEKLPGKEGGITLDFAWRPIKNCKYHA